MRGTAWMVSVLMLGNIASCVAQRTPWPNHAVRVVVPFSPGAFTDVAARSYAAELGALLGQQFVVDIRTGAGGTLGSDLVAKATGVITKAGIKVE